MNSSRRKPRSRSIREIVPIILRVAFSVILWTLGATVMTAGAATRNLSQPRPFAASPRIFQTMNSRLSSSTSSAAGRTRRFTAFVRWMATGLTGSHFGATAGWCPWQALSSERFGSRTAWKSLPVTRWTEPCLSQVPPIDKQNNPLRTSRAALTTLPGVLLLEWAGGTGWRHELAAGAIL